MKFARECLNNVRHEMQRLLDAHWREVELNQDKIPLQPDWEQYSKLDALNVLHIYTARSNGILVGYVVFFVSPAIHHREYLFAVGDVIYLEPRHRAGLNGIKLLQYAEQALKQTGVSLISINSKVDTPIDSLLKRAVFTNTERVYTKYIGE